MAEKAREQYDLNAYHGFSREAKAKQDACEHDRIMIPIYKDGDIGSIVECSSCHKRFCLSILNRGRKRRRVVKWLHKLIVG
jgi:hypothetical protein